MREDEYEERDFARILEDEFAGICPDCNKSNYDCRCKL